MKLKSKLIATIVSICAAIAVMGVGVWAATSTFTVSVTNNVNISFTNITGTIKLVATAQKTEAADGTSLTNITDDLTVDELYAAATTTTETVSIGNTTSEATHKWAGADLFTTKTQSGGYIDNKTTKAVLTYTFTYTPDASAGAGFTTIQITPVEPSTAKGASMEYSYMIGSQGGEADDVTGKTFYAADNTAITVTITATYENLKLVATEIGGASAVWSFNIVFANTLTEPSAGTDVVEL